MNRRQRKRNSLSGLFQTFAALVIGRHATITRQWRLVATRAAEKTLILP
jgi:hypothetical protein